MKKLLVFLLLALLCLSAAFPAGAETADDRLVTLSGQAEDTFVAQQDCYAKSDDVVIFFQKGMTVRGDMLAYVEEVMADLCQATGLTFEQNYPSGDNSYALDSYYEPGVFSHVTADQGKIYVLVADIAGYSPWAATNLIVLDIPDMERDNPFAIYHELAHVIYMRNATDMGLCIDEGLATWTVDRIYRSKGIVDWTTSFYMDSTTFDDACIAAGAEGFCHTFDNSDDNYCYGYRFITFLTETYGEEIIMKLLNAATADGFDPCFGEDEAADKLADTQHMKKILFSVAGEDVFDRFALWHEEELPGQLDEFFAYMRSMGEEF